MKIKEYFNENYKLFKLLFSAVSSVENSTVIGSVREEISRNLLSFFPEKKETGWIIDINGNTSGQVDIILPYPMCINFPGSIAGMEGAKGFLSTQVSATIEIKSGIGSSIVDIMKKTWSCHKLDGGFFTGRSTEKINDVEYKFIYEKWVPLIVIGSNGFADVQKYWEHFNSFESLDYSVNGSAVVAPCKIDQVIPDILLDLTYNKMLVHQHLNPNIIEKKLNLHKADEKKQYSIFENEIGGDFLKILIYYIDSFRNCLFVSHFTETARILDL